MRSNLTDSRQLTCCWSVFSDHSSSFLLYGARRKEPSGRGLSGKRDLADKVLACFCLKVARYPAFGNSIWSTSAFCFGPPCENLVLPGGFPPVLWAPTVAEPGGRSGGRSPKTVRRPARPLPSLLPLRQRSPETIRILARLDDVCPVGDAVQHRLAQPSVRNHLRPLGERQVRRQHHGRFLGSVGDHLEQELGRHFRQRHITQIDVR